MRIVNNDDGTRSVVLERKVCVNCNGTRSYRRIQSCPREGRPQRGRPCEYCNSTRKEHHYIQLPPETCPSCDENGTQPETVTDYVPSDWWTSILKFRVVENQPKREASFNENYLGFGYIYTVQDYGQSRTWTDERLIAKVRSEHGGSQLSQLLLDSRARDTDALVLAPYIEIIRRADGYNVRAHR